MTSRPPNFWMATTKRGLVRHLVPIDQSVTCRLTLCKRTPSDFVKNYRSGNLVMFEDYWMNDSFCSTCHNVWMHVMAREKRKYGDEKIQVRLI